LPYAGCFRIERGFERREPNAPVGLQKRLRPVRPQFQICGNQPINCRYNLIGRKSRSCAIADCRGLGCVTTKGDLIVFHPGTVQTQNADMTDVMMAAGVNTSRDFDLKHANIMLCF
jgi:hypothetical protein